MAPLVLLETALQEAAFVAVGDLGVKQSACAGSTDSGVVHCEYYSRNTAQVELAAKQSQSLKICRLSVISP